MAFSANGVMNGKDGVIKLAGNVVVNVKSWEYSSTQETTEFKVLGAPNSIKLGGVTSGTGSLSVYLDPDDSAHQTILNHGTGDLELYFDGDATGEYYWDVTGATFTAHSGSGADATTPGKETSVTFETGIAGAVLTQVT